MAAAPTGWCNVTFDGGISAPGGNITCLSKNLLDSGNNNHVFIDWKCAELIGLGTINDHGTADDADDTFDPADPTQPDSSTNGGALTMWVYDNITITVLDSEGNACPLTVSVNVVKDNSGSNSVFNDDVTISVGWLNGVFACMSGAGRSLVARWNGTAAWKLVDPTVPSTPAKDPATGDTKRVFGCQAINPEHGHTAPVLLQYASASDWTVVPQQVANMIGVVPDELVNLSGTATLRSLISANMVQNGQTAFPAATMSIQLPIGVIHTAKVLINTNANSAFGLLGGSFMDGLAIGIEGGPGGDETLILASGAVEPPLCPADLNGDNSVDGADLGLLLSQWDRSGPADMNDDGIVNGADLGLLLAAWGECPVKPTGACCTADGTCSVTTLEDCPVELPGVRFIGGIDCTAINCAPAADCCIANPNGSAGCADPSCESQVCILLAQCCDLKWDQLCADVAVQLCGTCPESLAIPYDGADHIIVSGASGVSFDTYVFTSAISNPAPFMLQKVGGAPTEPVEVKPGGVGVVVLGEDERSTDIVATTPRVRGRSAVVEKEEKDSKQKPVVSSNSFDSCEDDLYETGQLPPGKYQITVDAKNDDGNSECKLVLTIASSILGLQESVEIYPGKTKTRVKTVPTDPAGAWVTFSLKCDSFTADSACRYTVTFVTIE